MSNIQLFKNEKFGKVRVVEIEGKPYFAGVDVARVLGYSKVLPSIKETGGYIPVNVELSPEEVMTRALLIAQETIKRVEDEKGHLLQKAETS